MQPKSGEVYKHYKTGVTYYVWLISKDGNKESNQQYVTYSNYPLQSNTVEGNTFYTRSIEDFQNIMPSGEPRFSKVINSSANQ